MISLYNTLKESLLGGFDNLESSMDPIKEIEQFIKANYNFRGHLHISKEPNNDGKYEVSCKSVIVKNHNINSLTNGMFEWGEIDGDFDCYDCCSLISLKGAPKEVGGMFSCSFCNSLTSLDGAPKKVGGGIFSCAYCHSLTSLEGAPKEVRGSFNCANCDSLTSLKSCPKKVGVDFICHDCKQEFTEDDVRKICDVKGFVFTK